MEVFVLMGSIKYEGDVLLGVYSSQEEAVKAHVAFTSGEDRYIDQYYIEHIGVNAPADSCPINNIDL